MKKQLILFFVMLISIPALSQERAKFLYAAFADQSVTLYPFYKPFASNFDPAITFGTGIDYRHEGKSALFQSFQFTGFSTRIVGDGLNLTTSIGYRYGQSPGLFGELSLGVGASAFYSGWQTFSLDEDGTYTEVLPVHIIASVPADILLGFASGRYAFYMTYRYMIQLPYATAMPALPTSLTGIGIRYLMNK